MAEILTDTLARFEGVTSLCSCWKLVSRSVDKSVLATSHDRSVVFRNEVYLPGLALVSERLKYTLKMAPEPLDLSGALDAEGLTSLDLRAGVWDGARVMIYRVDWASPEHGIWLWSGNLTEIEEEGGAFRVRLASVKSDLERTIGRVFGRRCDADLSDARCGLPFDGLPQAACDKRFSTCRDVFGNTDNFRGFPHMPGNDVVISGPGSKPDGSSRGIER